MPNLFIKGLTSGIIAGIVMGATSMILYALKICSLCIIAIGGGIFSGQQMGGYNLYGLILAWFTHFALSGALGVLIAFLLHYTDTRYGLLKGAGLLTLVFLADIGIIAPLRGTIPNNVEFNDFLLLLSYHIFFGVLASYLFIKFSQGRLPNRV